MTSCIICHERFENTKNLGFQPTKCPPCFKRYAEQNPPIQLECVICNSKFNARDSNRKTCFPCGQAYAIKKQNEHQPCFPINNFMINK